MAFAREQAAPDRKCVRDVRGGAVHRALDAADDAPPPVGDEIAGGATEVIGDGTH